VTRVLREHHCGANQHAVETVLRKPALASSAGDARRGLYNPRYLMDSCDRERHRARRRNERLGVMMRRRAD